MDFAATRAVMANLHIPDRGVEDDRLENPINDWLAENGKLNVLAGAIAHPTKKKSHLEDGILLITRSIQARRNTAFSEADVSEHSADKVTREWLVREGGAQADEIDFVCLWDDFELTRNGFAPSRNNIQGHRPPSTTKYVTSADIRRWRDSNGGNMPPIPMAEFFRNEDREKWVKSNGGAAPVMTFKEYMVILRAEERAAAASLAAAAAPK